MSALLEQEMSAPYRRLRPLLSNRLRSLLFSKPYPPHSNRLLPRHFCSLSAGYVRSITGSRFTSFGKVTSASASNELTQTMSIVPDLALDNPHTHQVDFYEQLPAENYTFNRVTIESGTIRIIYLGRTSILRELVRY